MLHFLWNFITFVVALEILITVHEFGHFCVARYFGVMVERFSIGFGYSIWSKYDKYGTKYIIAAIPLGGYVKMLDERVDVITPENYHKTFNQKNIYQRIAIILAGPIFNFIFAFILYCFLFMIGVPGHRPIVGDIVSNSIASRAGISPGMELKAIDGILTPDWDEVRLQVINKIGKSKLNIDVSLFDSLDNIKKTLYLQKWIFEIGKQDPIIALGIIPFNSNIEPVLIKIKKNSVGARAGLKVGDRIIKVDGLLVYDWSIFTRKIRDSSNSFLQVTVIRNKQLINIFLKPDYKTIKEKKEGFIGIAPNIIPLSSKYQIIRQFNLISAINQSLKKTWQLFCATFNMLIKLIIGDINLSNLRGPITIAQNAGASAKYGLIYYLMFLVLISINLGIINLFPLPILDGGHIFFIIIEKIKKSPISERIQDFCYRISIVLLVLLMGLALFNDLFKL